MKRRIAFVIFPHVELLDLAGPLQVFTEAQYQGLAIEVNFYTYAPTPVVCSAGLALGALQPYSNALLQEGDYLLIPGIKAELLQRDEAAETAFAAWLIVQANNNIKICAVCNAAFIVAATGLLNNRECTTHWRSVQLLQQMFPLVKVVADVLFVKSGNIYTSAGISSGIDLALSIIEELKDAFFAHKVARALVIYHRRNAGDTQHSIYLQYRNHVNARVHQVQDFLIDNLHMHYTTQQLAGMAAMSERNLSRVFKESTGTTLNHYVTLLRVEKAKTLLHNEAHTMDYIAAQCGFKSARQLRRILA